MNKLFTSIIALCLSSTLLFSSTNSTCTDVMFTYGIDYNIKRSKGWRRVCNNNKIHLYSNITLDKESVDFICRCVKKSKTKTSSRAIGSRTLVKE